MIYGLLAVVEERREGSVVLAVLSKRLGVAFAVCVCVVGACEIRVAELGLKVEVSLFVSGAVAWD